MALWLRVQETRRGGFRSLPAFAFCIKPGGHESQDVRGNVIRVALDIEDGKVVGSFGCFRTSVLGRTSHHRERAGR
jgi:hypothetical protein